MMKRKLHLVGVLLTLLFSYQIVYSQNTCATATVITGSGPYTAPGPTTGGGCNNCGGATNANWYSYTATADGTIDVSACADPGDTDTRLWVYDGSCGSLNQIASNDDACNTSGYSSEVTGVPVTNGTTYFLEWDDRWSTSGFDFEFTFTPPPACPDPSALGATNITTTSADVYWTSGGATDWNVEYGLDGFIRGGGTGTLVNATNDTLTISSLSAQMDYDFYVRDSCGVGNVSAWIGPFTFTTLCNPISTPVTEDLETTTSGIPDCWNQTAATTYSWRVDQGGTPSSATGPTVDNTLGTSGGTYIFVEASNGSTGDMATLTSPAYDISGLTVPQLSFYYHMHGSQVTYLKIEAFNTATSMWDSLTSIIGEQQAAQGDPYQEALVDLSAYQSNGQVTLRFTTEKGTGALDYEGDVALDDITVREAPSCSKPTALGATNITATGADIYWTTGGASDWNVEYGLDGFIRGGGTGTMINATNDTITLASLMSATDYDFYVRDSCGVGDVSAWEGPFSFITLCTSFSPPQLEDFTAGFPPTSCWDEGDGGTPATGPTALGAGEWTADGFGNNGTTGAVKINLYDTGDDDWLLTPQYDLTTGGPYQVEFDFGVFVWTSGSSGSAPGTLGSDDEVQLLISTDNGASWTNLATYNSSYVTAAAGNHEVINLTAYSSNTVQFGIWATEGSTDDPEDNDVFVDNFEVRAIPSCADPSALGATNITATSADVYWTSGGATDWNVEYGLDGFIRGGGTGTLVNATNDTLTISSLSAQTDYDFYVRDSCGVGNVSAWIGPFSFTTPCAAVATPATEDFETTSSGIPDCWSQTAATTYSWRVDQGGTPSSATGPTVDNTLGTSGGTYIYVEATNGSTGDMATLTSPTYDISGLTVPQLSFYYHMHGSQVTYLKIEAFNTATSMWDSLTSIIGEQQAAQGDPYQEALVNLSAYQPNGQVVLRFTTEKGTGSLAFEGDVALDDITVAEAPSCIAPTNLGVTNLTSSSADAYWTTGGAANWNIEYGPDGYAFGNGTRLIATNDTTTIPGLMANTPYDFYVQDSCGIGDVSTWEGPFSFTTLCTSQLNGAYTINSAQPTGGTNFNSFADALVELLDCGVSGPVTFNVAAGTYAENITLTEITGASSVNTITFDGGSASTTEITHTSTTDEPTIYFDGADHVTIKNMTVSNNSPSDGWGILFQNSSDSNTVDNCHIKMPVGTTTDIIGIVASNSLSSETSTGDNANYLTISNSTFTGGETGVHLTGGSTSSAHNLGNKIMDNVFRDQDDHGIEVDGQTNIVVSGNDVDSLNNTGGDGIYLVDVNDFEVLANRVVAPDYGIYVNDGNDGYSATANSTVINNMSISETDYGIYLNDFEFVEVYHNNAVGEPAMAINDQDTTVIIKNNIFYSTADYAFESLDTVTANDVIDYNVYYTGGTDLVEILSTVITDLAAWQTIDATRNANSLEGDPSFVDLASDLHVLGAIANNVADPSVGVTVDIDGDPRSGTTPDIGADEFTPASCTPPSALGVFNIAFTSADIYWTTGGAANWNVEYGSRDFIFGTGTRIQATNDTLTISGLSASSSYDFYVQDSCGIGDVSNWIGPFNFNTLCGTFTAPYSQNFDGAPAQDPFGGILCWSIAGPGADDIELNDSPDAGLDPAPSLPNSVELNDGDFDAGDTAILVSPQFSDLPSGNNRIRFKAAFENVNEELFIGVMSDPMDASTLVILDTITTSTEDVYIEYIVNMDNTTAIGTAEHVTFVHGTDIYEVYVDDFFYEAIPISCTNTAGMDSTGSVCATNTMVDLSTYLRMADPGGAWADLDATGALTGAMFDASQVATGNAYNFGYVVSATGCPDDTAMIAISVDPVNSAGMDSTGTVCEDNMAVDLSTYLRMADAGGSWLDDDATGALTGTSFDASQVTAGASYNFTYFVSGGTCPNDSATITINVEALPNAGSDANDTICDTITVDLSTYLGTSDPGGLWEDVDGTGALTGSSFDASQVTVNASYRFRYIVSGVVCPNDTANLSIYVEDCSIGIDEYGAASSISVYPNPTGGVLHIENKGLGTQSLEVELYAANGQLVIKDVFDGNDKVTLDISDLAKGMYQLRVTADNGIYSQQIMRQ